MLRADLPPPLDRLIATLTSLLDKRHAELLRPLFLGLLLADGRRTATAWFRAAGIADDFRRAYTLLGTLGRAWVDTFASLLFCRLARAIDPGPRWLFAIDDSPTPRYGPCVEGAGIHHNPTPGPAHQKFLYGHVWVTLARVVRHPPTPARPHKRFLYGHVGVPLAWVVRPPLWHVLALPLLAALYIREKDLPRIDADRRPAFATKLAQAAGQIAWAAEQVRGTGK